LKKSLISKVGTKGSHVDLLLPEQAQLLKPVMYSKLRPAFGRTRVLILQIPKNYYWSKFFIIMNSKKKFIAEGLWKIFSFN